MAEENILAYKLYLSLNISDFSLFFMWKLQPPEKSHPLFPSNSPLKAEVLSSLEERGGGGGRVHTMCLAKLHSWPFSSYYTVVIFLMMLSLILIYMSRILLSTLNVIEYLVRDSSLRWLLNLNLTYKVL